MTTSLIIAALLAAEWVTRPPRTGRHHAPQAPHLPRRHHRGNREVSA